MKKYCFGAILLLVLVFSACASDIKAEEKEQLQEEKQNVIESKLDQKRRQVEETEKLIEEEKEKLSRFEEILNEEPDDDYMRQLAEEQGYEDGIIFEDISGN